MRSPLQLRHIRLLSLTYEVNPNFNPSQKLKSSYTHTIDYGHSVAQENDRLHRVSLFFSVKGHGLNIKKLGVAVEGFFELEQGVSEDIKHELLPYTAVALLYSHSRGLVQGLVGGYLCDVMPSLNIVKVVNDKLNSQVADPGGRQVGE